MHTKQRLAFSRRMAVLIRLRREAKSKTQRQTAGEQILHMLKILSSSKQPHPYTL